MRGSWLLGLVVVLAVAAGAGWFFLNGENQPRTGERVEVSLPPASATPSLLLPAPDPALIEESPDGFLPIIGKDGRQAWQAYARSFDRNDKRPRIALVVSGLGLDRALSQAATDRLAGPITLAFDPYTADMKDAINQARSLGHETLVGLPMEPLDYPRQDPGPLTLLVSLGETQNTERLKRLMASGAGYVGFVTLWGERFSTEKSALLPILETLKQRGLMFVDNKPPAGNSTALLASQIKLPWAAADRAIDSEDDPATIDHALADLESTARRNGVALGLAALSPALVDHVATWTATIAGKGLVLAPASAVVNRQSIAATESP
jgi:polysaccharide deacetylase 2 family uncharacterized protein YibQ